MMRAFFGLMLVLVTAGGAFAGPLDVPGATKALTCSACHGMAGQSLSNAMPIIAGISPAYFKKAIEDYASGKRPSPKRRLSSRGFCSSVLIPSVIVNAILMPSSFRMANVS